MDLFYFTSTNRDTYIIFPAFFAKKDEEKLSRENFVTDFCNILLVIFWVTLKKIKYKNCCDTFLS